MQTCRPINPRVPVEPAAPVLPRQLEKRIDIVGRWADVYKPAHARGLPPSKTEEDQGVGKNAGQNQELSAVGQRAIYERAPTRIFSGKTARLARRYTQGSQRNIATPPGRKSKSPRSCRSRVLGNRPRNRTARARPPTQAHR